MKFELIHGVILAVISFIIMVAFYFGGISFFSGTFFLLSTAVHVAYLVYAGLLKRKEGVDGFLDYGTAFKSIFIISLLAGVIGGLASCLAFSDNDKIKQDFQTYTVESGQMGFKLGAMMSGKSAEEAEVAAKEREGEIKEKSSSMFEIEDPFSFDTFIFGMVTTVFYSLIWGLIISIFVRKNPT